MLKIVKFGGSSLADAGQFRKVKSIIEAEASRRYVVPSAPGKRFSGDVKVTDMLYDCYEKAAAGKDCRDNLISIRSRYESIIQELALEGFTLKEEFAKIEEHLSGTPERDYIASRGEYLNGLILAAYLGIDFIDAAEVICFREDGTFDDHRTERKMKDRLSEVERAVIPGFYGSLPDGRIRTFSRGGSDITGSIVAAAVHADVYENWTDVSGFKIADPRIVEDPAGIETITYRELRELSYMGASVLHDEAIFPVRRIGIPINIRNTNAPQDEGTWIVESTAQKSGYVITGIAGKKGFCAVDITKSLMNSEIGFGRKVLQAFEENGISFEHMPSGIDTMTIVVHEDEFIEKEQRVVSAIHRLAAPDSVVIESDIALIAVVGRGMRSARGTAGRIFSALAHAQVNVRMIDQGSSELNIIIGVENRDFETAIRAIYDIFVVTQL